MAAPRKFNKRSTAEDVVYGVDLARKTFMVTGANSGIGEFELHLLTYIHCMDTRYGSTTEVQQTINC